MQRKSSRKAKLFLCQSVNKRLVSLGLISGLLFSPLSGVAAPGVTNGGADNDSESSVAQFQQWLSEQDQKNQAAVSNVAAESQSNMVNNGAASGLNDQANSDESDVSQLAFEALKKQTMPMSPRQMQEYKRLVQKAQLVQASSTGTPPKPVSSTLVVNLAPGATPPAVRLSQGFISSLVFVDSSGAPWPIVAYDLGNPNAFNLQWDKVSNVLMIQPLEAYTYGNLAIRLKGLATPVMLTLVPGQAEVDYRVDMRVSGVGPNASGGAAASALPDGVDPMLLNVLDGIAPAGSKELAVLGASGQAWSNGDVLYFRTRATVLSPGWLDQMNSPDGMHAYALPVTPTVLISRYGKPVEVQIEDQTSE